jgi:hypothetical protein
VLNLQGTLNRAIDAIEYDEHRITTCLDYFPTILLDGRKYQVFS